MHVKKIEDCENNLNVPQKLFRKNLRNIWETNRFRKMTDILDIAGRKKMNLDIARAIKKQMRQNLLEKFAEIIKSWSREENWVHLLCKRWFEGNNRKPR